MSKTLVVDDLKTEEQRKEFINGDVYKLFISGRHHHILSLPNNLRNNIKTEGKKDKQKSKSQNEKEN